MEGAENRGDDHQDDEQESKEKEKNIIKSLPSRRIASWKLKSKRKKSIPRKQKSLDGRVYMPVDGEASDDSVLVDVEELEALAGKKGKYIAIKPLSERLEEKRRLRSTSQSSDSRSLSFFTGIRYGIAMSFKITYQRVKDCLKMLELWRGHFREIEGSFGNGILSFFTFLRWLLYVNLLLVVMAVALLVIPQALHTREISAVIVSPTQGNSSTNSSSTAGQRVNLTLESAAEEILQSRAGFLGANTSRVAEEMGCKVFKPEIGYSPVVLMSDFMQGMGWINTTLMFYGSYSSKILVMPTDSLYNMPMAYFLVSTLSFVVVLLLTLWSASSIIEDNYIKEGVKHYNSYSNKVFGGWDYCVTNGYAAELKVKSFVRELEGDLAEDLRLANLSQRTRTERIKIYTIRIAINLLVLLLSGGAGWAIYTAAQLSLNTAQKDVNTKSGKTTEIAELLKSYASSITLTVLNSVLPTLFYFLSRLEDWNPRVQVNIDLARTVLLKLASVAVLLISLFQKINDDQCILCWENAIAAEMYKLIWMDFLVVVAVALFYHTPRRYVADNIDLGIKLGQKIGRPVFIIPQNVLELVYAQCLIWIGMWYSPLLALMGCAKFFILFYVKKLTLKYNCQSEEKAYRAGKSNYFFMLLLLVTFFLCVAAVVYGVSQIRPSILYGPFRGLDRMYRIIPLTIHTLPIGFQDFYKVIQSPVFVIGIIIIICLGLYFFYASAKVYNHMITELREELAMETRDKKYLLKKLSEP